MKTSLTCFLFLTLFCVSRLGAQTIPNPSFETENFTVFPGYVSGNGSITGWTGTVDTSYGQNPAAGSPFANNGVVPNGVNVAFIQSGTAAPGNAMQTVITDLVGGTTYNVTFRTSGRARAGEAPVIDVAIDGSLQVTSIVRAVGGTAPFTWVGFDFTASDVNATLSITNTLTAGDHTVNIDDFQIREATGNWTFAAWNDDSTSGVDPAFNYTHAYNFGSTATPTLINEVPFAAAAGINPAVAGSFSTDGLGGAVAADANNVTGGSRAMANTFVYNGFPATLSLSGLNPNEDYVVALYSVGWEDGLRVISFKSGDDVLSVNQDAFGNNNGIRIECAYTADNAGNAVIEAWPLGGGSFHCYGFTNREAAPIADTAPSFVIQPIGGEAADGTTFTLSAATTGTRPITYQWFLDDVAIGGEMANTLTVNVADENNAGFYRVEATNTFGSVSSDAAFLEVYVQIPGLFFATGVDATGVPLAGGLDDPHYTITASPGGALAAPAVVQTNVPGAWLANSGTSQWVGPSADTVAAAGGDFTYETTFDLTGQGTGLVIAGGWASDNVGLAIQVNGVPVPNIAMSNTFAGFTNFLADTTLLPPGTVIAGINTLEFVVNNAGAGFTGLRVDNIGAATVPNGVAPIIFEHPQGQDVTTGDMVVLSANAYGSADLLYQWRKDGSDIAGENGKSYTIASTTVADAGNYDVVVTNTEGTATSTAATLTATDVPPSITTPPASQVAGVSQTVEFSVVAEGSPTLTYQWQKGGSDIDGETGTSLTIGSVTKADTGDYTVVVTNPFGTVTSDVASLEVFDLVPGLFNTGVDATSVPLADNTADNHYTLLVNPNGAPLDQPVVQDSTVFPIVVGPWLLNNSISKWIGPEFNTVASAAGDYTYTTSFDLSGFDLNTVVISGGWASDNAGLDIFINGTSTGNTTTGFDTYFPFTISSGFVEGFNTLDFVVNNAAAGYTGLRVEGIQGLGTIVPAVDLPQIDIALNGVGNPVITFVGSQSNTYSVERSPSMQNGTWTNLGTIAVPLDGNVSWEDTSPLAGQAYYRIVVSVGGI